MTDFGLNDPRDMPVHLFLRAVSIDDRTAVRAAADRQNRSICPRYRRRLANLINDLPRVASPPAD